MNIIENLLKSLRKSNNANSDDAPEGLCPNCWGRQEYGGNFYNAVKNHGLDINSQNPEIGWINDYAEKHLKGIKLEQKGESLACPHCKISYKKE